MERKTESIVHDACNEALSIAMGVRMLADLPAELITDDQREALELIRKAAHRLHQLVESLAEVSFESPG